MGNVTWTSPGQTSADSMPLGNGHIAANVWTEPDGDIVFYLAKCDAWDHLGRLIKVGRIRVQLTPGLLGHGRFEQTLSLEDAAITVSNGITTLRLWCDANHPRFIIECDSTEPCEINARFDGWRTKARPLTDRETHSAGGLENGPLKLETSADTLVSEQRDAVIWYQRNTSSVWAQTLGLQGLGEFKEQSKDPLLGRTFGACMQGPGFINHGRDGLVTSGKTCRAVLTVTVLCEQVESAASWIDHIKELASPEHAPSPAKAWLDHCVWWHEFWRRSHIRVEARAPDWGHAETITQQVAWHRFMVACCSRGTFPVKFNGGLFTADWGLPDENYDADYRRWGGGYWWQNTRLIYWSLLANGDYELMSPLFRMYRDMLPLAEHRTRKWFGHDGAFFPETLYFWGTHLPSNYGWDREGKEPGDVQNQYIRRYWQSGLELIALMLETYGHTHDQALLESTLLPVTRSVLTFYALHYADDANGKLCFSPAQSLETWWDAENPMPEIAALHYLLPRLLKLPADSLQASDFEAWRALAARVPSVPVGEREGKRQLLAASTHESVPHNSENPELYAVFPYKLYGIGRPDLELAQWTYTRRMYPDTGGWRQDAIQAALLGLTESAVYYLAKNYTDGNLTPARFKGFWGPNYDWVPDFDHGSVGQIALQTMLVQTVGDRIYLFPAWPEGRWNVSFRLHLPRKTLVECELKDGRISRLEITPRERKRDIIVLLGKNKSEAAEMAPFQTA